MTLDTKLKQPANKCSFFPHGSSTVVGQGLIVGVSRSQSDTTHSVRLLWTSDQPDAEDFDNAQHSEAKDVHTPGRIQTRKPHPASGRRPTP